MIDIIYKTYKTISIPMIMSSSWKPRKNVHLTLGPDWLQIQPQPKAIADSHTRTDVGLVQDESDRLFDMDGGSMLYDKGANV